MFLEPLAATSILLASAGVSPPWCVASKPAQVRVGLVAPQPTANLSRDMKQLEGFHINTQNPYGAHADTHVGGVTDGTVRVEQKMNLGGVRYGDQSCLWFADVDLTIHLVQKVYVASDYKPGSCMYNAVWDHEHKHVRVDREIINKYRPVYEQAVQSYIAQAVVVGPVPQADEKKVQAALMEKMRQVVARVTDQMEAERGVRQQSVDTRAEYDRVSAMCRGRK